MTPTRIPLILIPGLLCTAALFDPQLVALVDIAEMTVAGHQQHALIEKIAVDILAAAPPQFALAGLSMGGYIAFEVLRQAPHRVTRLALMDTNARADRPEQLASRNELVALARSGGLGAVNAKLLPLLVHPDHSAAIKPVIERMADDTGVEAFARQQAAIAARPDNRAFLSQIQVPTVIIVGADDALTPVKVHEEMHAGIAGSSLHVIPRCGHLATLEAPDAVNRILRDWLLATAGTA